MCKDSDKDKKEKNKEGKNMDVAIKRPCSPNESLKESLKEMNLIRQGKLPKKTWQDLKAELQENNN